MENIIKFGDIEIEKQKFYQHKRHTVSFVKNGFKYFIGYKDAKIRPLIYISPKIERI